MFTFFYEIGFVLRENNQVAVELVDVGIGVMGKPPGCQSVDLQIVPADLMLPPVEGIGDLRFDEIFYYRLPGENHNCVCITFMVLPSSFESHDLSMRPNNNRRSGPSN